MKIVRANGGWRVESDDGQLIALLRNEVEVAAVAELCRRTLEGRVPEHFPVRHGGFDYMVTPLGEPGEKLALVITGSGRSSRIETEFVVPS